MIILAMNRLCFISLCIYPFYPETQLKHKIYAFLFSLYVFTTDLLAIVLSILFLNNIVKSDVNKSMYALIQISSTSCTFFCLIHAYIIRRQIEGIFVKLQTIYDGMFFPKYIHNFDWLLLNIEITTGMITDGSDEIQKILSKTNEKCEWVAKVLIIYVPAGFGISISSTAILNIIFCLIKDGTVEVENLFFPSKFAYVCNTNRNILSLIHSIRFILFQFTLESAKYSWMDCIRFTWYSQFNGFIFFEWHFSVILRIIV